MEITKTYVSKMMAFAKDKLDNVTDDWRKSVIENGLTHEKTLELNRSVSYWTGRLYTWQLVYAKILAPEPHEKAQ